MLYYIYIYLTVFIYLYQIGLVERMSCIQCEKQYEIKNEIIYSNDYQKEKINEIEIEFKGNANEEIVYQVWRCPKCGIDNNIKNRFCVECTENQPSKDVLSKYIFWTEVKPGFAEKKKPAKQFVRHENPELFAESYYHYDNNNNNNNNKKNDAHIFDQSK